MKAVTNTKGAKALAATMGTTMGASLMGAALSILFIPTASHALSEQAEAGKAQFALCQSCHNPELSPALAPPMFGIQRRYKRAYGDKENVVASIASYVPNPTIEKALMKKPVAELGLMPALSLPEENLRQIASYIYEETFAAPCTHWQMALEKAKQAGQSDDDHSQNEQRNYDRFCR